MGDLQRMVEQEDLSISRRKYIEEESAFKPGRKVFSELVKATKAGTVSSWLCWHPNRLARNATDAGKVIQLLDDGYLFEIKTPTRTYRNTPEDKTFLMIDLVYSKRDSDDKSELVKSGMTKRYERGFPSGNPSVGFSLLKSEYESSVWTLDQERFPLVQKLFRRFLQGKMSIQGLANYADSIGLTTPCRRKTGGKSLSRSAIHRNILRNPIYAGFFFDSKDRRYELHPNLPRVLTEKEYCRVRALLSERKTSEVKHSSFFIYRDLIKDQYGRKLLADRKHQLRCECGFKFAHRNKAKCPRCQTFIEDMENPRFLEYTYYCANYISDGGILKKRSISEIKINEAVHTFMKRNLPLSLKKRRRAAEHLDDRHRRERLGKKRVKETLQEKKKRIGFERDRLRAFARQGIISGVELQRDFALLDLEEAKPKKEDGASCADLKKLFDS